MKYCPLGFFETVAVPIFPFLTLLFKTNLIRLSEFLVFKNLGI
jgi:hypothetical protein